MSKNAEDMGQPGETADPTPALGRIDPICCRSPSARCVRATAASAGLLRELGDVALSGAVRRTSLYRNMVEGTLRFLIKTVGDAVSPSLMHPGKSGHVRCKAVLGARFQNDLELHVRRLRGPHRLCLSGDGLRRGESG